MTKILPLKTFKSLAALLLAAALFTPYFPAQAQRPAAGQVFSFVPHPEITPHIDLNDPHLVAHGEGQPPVSVEGDAPAQPAAPTAVDDRDNTEVVSWYVYEHYTSLQVYNTAVNNNLRVVDLFLESAPDSFTAVFVSNTGSYQKTWWIYVNMTPTDLLTFVNNNSARVTVLKTYTDAGGNELMDAVMISNTGADNKIWWFLDNQTTASLTTFWQNNNARITQINSYTKNGSTKYAAVLISNTGADSRTWYWYVEDSVSQAVNQISSFNARLIDLDIAPSGNYNVVMVDCSSNCPLWWWYVNVTTNDLLNIPLQNGARIIDANSTAGCGDRCWSFVLINNSNAITTRVGQILRNGSDGTLGLYLKQVNGPLLANLMDGSTFEPASAIKAVTHLYYMRSLIAGTVTKQTLIPKYQPPTSGSCPGNTVIGSETIDTADREMMFHSDNTRTRELNDYFGVNNVNLMANNLGLVHTAILHVVGCGSTQNPNQTTLDDLGKLYEDVALANTVDAARRTLFFANMAGKSEYQFEGYDWTGLWSTDLPAMIQQEAPLGAKKPLLNWFRSSMDLSYKAGNYNLCTNNSCSTLKYDIAISGWAQVPFCDGGGARQFVFGIYIYNATNLTQASNTFTAAKAELLREQIHDGLASCNGKIKAAFTPLLQR